MEGQHSFPQSHHLLGSDIRRVMRESKKIKGRRVLYYLNPSLEPHSRLGFTVSKKVAGAVGRNAIRRLWKEAFRLERNDFPKSWELLIRPLPGYQLQPLEELREILRKFE